MVGVMLGGLAGSVQAATVPDPADKKIQQAFTYCEQGLMLPVPRSIVGLKTLQRYFKKYETYRNAATILNPQIVKSDALYKPKNAQFGEKDYKSLYGQCETELVAKITAAQPQVEQQVAQSQSAAAQRADLIKKLTAEVMPTVTLTLDLCTHYTQNPLPEDADDKARSQFNADANTYKNQKKQILSTHPGILQTPYKSLRRDFESDTVEEVDQVLLYWFEYCDGIFVTPQSEAAALDTEGPPLPDDNAAPAKQPDDQPPPDNMDDGIDDSAAILDEAMKNAQGDRKKILEQQKRLPDFTDNDSDQYNAKTWFFDHDGDKGSECQTFIFDKNHSLSDQKTTKGLCEPPK
jgi:hypothetical protein